MPAMFTATNDDDVTVTCTSAMSTLMGGATATLINMSQKLTPPKLGSEELHRPRYCQCQEGRLVRPVVCPAGQVTPQLGRFASDGHMDTTRTAQAQVDALIRATGDLWCTMVI